MKRNLFTSALCCTVFLSSLSQAASSKWYLTVGGGEQYPQFPSSMTVNNNSDFEPPYNQDIYDTKQRHQPFFLISAGKRWVRKSHWFPSYSLGLQFQHAFTQDIGGTVTQYSDPEFTNYTYQWNLYSNELLAVGKMNLFSIGRVSPYVSAGIGGVVNTTDNYTESALPGVTAPRTSPGFADESNLQFAYQLGAGVDLQMNKQMLFTIGYLYQDLGEAKSGSGASSWSNRSLDLGTVKTNSVFLALTYLFKL